MGVLSTQIAIQITIALTLLLSAIAANAQEGSETVETAAKKAYDKGAEELAAGNHTGAITLLKTAVRIQPKNAAYQHKLAKAFLAAQKYHQMWVHLRKATVLEIGNEEYSNDFLRMWKYHDLQGMFNVGTNDAAVLKALGEPDRRVENDTMKRWIYGFMAIDYGTNPADGTNGVFRVIDLRGYTTEMATEVEKVRVKTDPGVWQVAHHQISRTDDNLELTLKNEKIQQWSELFSKQRFPLMSESGATIESMVGSIQNALKAADPNVEFNIISQSPERALYHWTIQKTENEPAQHEVATIIKGQKDFYRVAYVKKTERLTESEFARWTKIIGDATLVPTADRANSTSSASGTNNKLHAWELGKNLSFAALVRGQHGAASTVTSTLMKVSKSAQVLNVAVPAPGKLTDDVTADTASAIEFLLETAGKPIYNSLEKNHSGEHAALFELATKSSLLIMLYQPGDSTSNSIAAAIERSATKAKINAEIWKPLTVCIQEESDNKTVVSAIRKMQSEVADSIRSPSVAQK